MSKGFVYVLENAGMPGLLKIGKTARSVTGRASELYQTGVPFPFDVVTEVLSPDCSALEQEMHAVFSGSRVSPSREFFAVKKQEAQKTLEDLHFEQVSLWLSEFLPGHTCVDENFFVDPGDISSLAEIHGVSPEHISMSLSFLRPEHIDDALARMRERGILRGSEEGQDK